MRPLALQVPKRDAAEYAALWDEAGRTGGKIFLADEAHFRADAELQGKWVLKGEPTPQSPELGDRRLGRYTERVLLSVSTAQWILYRRSAEDGRGLADAMVPAALEAAVARERVPAPPSRPSGAYDDRVEITMTPEQ